MKHLKSIFESIDDEHIKQMENIFGSFLREGELRVEKLGALIRLQISANVEQLFEPDGSSQYAGFHFPGSRAYSLTNAQNSSIVNAEEFTKFKALYNRQNEIITSLKNYLVRFDKFGYKWSISNFTAFSITIDVVVEESEYTLKQAFKEGRSKLRPPNFHILKKVLKDKYNLDLEVLEEQGPAGSFIYITGDQTKNKPFLNELNKIVKIWRIRYKTSENQTEINVG